jgi:hypothetical protein
LVKARLPKRVKMSCSTRKSSVAMMGAKQSAGKSISARGGWFTPLRDYTPSSVCWGRRMMI